MANTLFGLAIALGVMTGIIFILGVSLVFLIASSLKRRDDLLRVRDAQDFADERFDLPPD